MKIFYIDRLMIEDRIRNWFRFPLLRDVENTFYARRQRPERLERELVLQSKEGLKWQM
jgi:hypothetical protein